jgi:IS6 family transposase
VKGHWCYLYRAIDSTGATIDFLLSALRDAAAAKRLFRMALSDPSHPQPRVINTDKARLYGSAIATVKAEGTLRRRCRHRPVQYLNNILEQDHRAIKRRVKAKQSFREFRAARRTIAGYEAMHMIRKGQTRWVSENDVRQQNRFIDQLFDLAA